MINDILGKLLNSFCTIWEYFFSFLKFKYILFEGLNFLQKGDSTTGPLLAQYMFEISILKNSDTFALNH